MRTSLSHRLRTAITEQIAQLDTRYYRLLLLAGAPGSGKTSLLRAYQEELSCPLINLNLALSHRLLEVKRGARALQVQDLLDEVLAGGNLLLVDNIELLFDSGLQLNPLRALKGASRHRSLVVAWPGVVDGGCLTYAEPGHPEYQYYEPHELVSIIAVDVGVPGEG